MAEVHMKIRYLFAILFFTFGVQVTVGQSSITAIESYRRGYERQQRGDLRGAISDYDKTLKTAPNFVEAYIARASARYRLGDLEGANADYDIAIKIGAEYAEAYLGRGTVRTERNNLDGAIEDYSKAISMKPEYAEAYYGRCLDRYLKGEFDRAILDCDRAVKINPRYANAYQNRALARYGKGDFDGAIADYNTSMEIDPQISNGYYNRALAYQAKADLDRAIADYTKDLEINPRHPEAFYLRGLARERKGDRQGAMSDFDKSIEIGPKLGRPYCSRGLAFLSQSRDAEAEGDLKKCFEIEPGRRSEVEAQARKIRQERSLPLEDPALLAPVSVKKDLYPADADAAKEIEAALKQAVIEKKRVLLMFGGNWCYDCHVLDRALHEGDAGKIVKESFLLVHVDIGEGDKNLDLVKKYKTTLDKGVPVVVVLDNDDSALYSSDDGEFEAARKMMKQDLVAFLMHWRGKRQ
jgi:tetratricopeptide (TPR) repeat protein